MYKMTFQVVDEQIKTNKKFKIARRSVCFKLNNMPENVIDPEEWVKNGIMDVVAHVIQDVDPNDKVGFTFGAECFPRLEAHLSFKKAAEVTFQEIWDLLGQIYHSKTEGFHSDTFRITMTQAKAN